MFTLAKYSFFLFLLCVLITALLLLGAYLFNEVSAFIYSLFVAAGGAIFLALCFLFIVLGIVVAPFQKHETSNQTNVEHR
jgi:hypothetical protein